MILYYNFQNFQIQFISADLIIRCAHHLLLTSFFTFLTPYTFMLTCSVVSPSLHPSKMFRKPKKKKKILYRS